MSRIMFTLRFSVFVFLGLCQSAVLSAEASMLPKTIGHLDSKDALVFQGNKSYTKDQICEALYRDKDVIVSISPTAPLSGFLRTLETKVRLGYLNDGFRSPQVRASYVEQPEHILISIVEGPRYAKGPLVIHGASDTLKKELTHCLSNIDPRVSEATGASDVMKSIQKGEMSAALSKDIYMALLWGGSKPPSFAPSFVKTSTQYLHNLLKVLGYYESEFTLELVPDHDSRTVGLHIAFQAEGIRASIGAINISGNKINSDEQVLTYLELKTGRPLDGVLTQTLQTQLINSGRFRSVEVKPEINTADPANSTLTITLEETTPATPLGGELTEKEALMQKVGQFMARYQSWEKDFWFRLDLPKHKGLGDLGRKHGVSIPVIEGVYSSQRGVILNEIIGKSQALNTFIISPEQVRYVCPTLNQNILCTEPTGELKVQVSLSPDSTEKADGWYIKFGMGLGSGCTGESFSYQPEINFHPASWFHNANDPDTRITFVDDTRALVVRKETEIEVDRRTGEIIEIRGNLFYAVFQESAFDNHIAQFENNIREGNYTLKGTDNNAAVIWSSLLPLYLTHTTRGSMALDQKVQVARTWRRMMSVFDECATSEDDTALWEKDFPLPIDESLAEGGMMPMLLSAIYQACHDSLPRDSWVRTLSHISVLIVSGHAQCEGVSQELQQLYNSDQIGPVGYLLTAKVLRALGFPAYGAFAERGLHAMSAEDFRKDWKPLLIKESDVKEMIQCYLENFQTHSAEDVRLVASVFKPDIALLIEGAATKIRETQTGQLYESLDPVLTDFWEKTGRKQIQQQLNDLINPPKKVAVEDTTQNGPAGIYALLTVDGTKIPGTVSHGGHDLKLHSGVFIIHPDGTCTSQTIFNTPSGEKVTRQVKATYTQDGSTLHMQWEGFGRTTGTVEGNTFSMNNEGMIFAYQKQVAPPEGKVVRPFNGDFEGGTYTHALGMPMPLGWDGGGGSFCYEKDGSNGYIRISNGDNNWAVAHTEKPPIPLTALGLTAGKGVMFRADVIGLEGKPHAHLKFEQYKDGGKTANGIAEHHFIPTENWKQYSATFEIKPDTDSAVFVIVGLSQGASHGIDNVTITPADNLADNKITIGKPFPDLEFNDLEGNRVSLSDLKGKVVLIDFWATWCGPCRAETPNLLSVYNDYHDKGLEIIGISLDKDRQQLDAYLDKHQIKWPNHFDGNGWNNELASQFGIRSIPNIVLIDHQGTVRVTKLRGDNIRMGISQLIE